MQDIDIQAASKSWRNAPDEHLTQAVKNLNDYDPSVSDIIIKEAKNRFGDEFVMLNANSSLKNKIEKDISGIGRKGYFIGWAILIVMNILWGLMEQNILLALMGKNYENITRTDNIIALRVGISTIIMGCLIIARLENIGMDWKWSLLMPVPILNLFLIIPCFAYQAGYTQTRQIDNCGKKIIFVLIGIFVFTVIVYILASALSNYYLG